MASSSHEDIKVACVQTLKVLSQEESLAGLQVAHLWLATLLSMLAPRVKDYASVTQITPADVYAAQLQQQQGAGYGDGEQGVEEAEPDTVGLNQYLGKLEMSLFYNDSNRFNRAAFGRSVFALYLHPLDLEHFRMTCPCVVTVPNNVCDVALICGCDPPAV